MASYVCVNKVGRVTGILCLYVKNGILELTKLSVSSKDIYITTCSHIAVSTLKSLGSLSNHDDDREDDDRK